MRNIYIFKRIQNHEHKKYECTHPGIYLQAATVITQAGDTYARVFVYGVKHTSTFTQGVKTLQRLVTHRCKEYVQTVKYTHRGQSETNLRDIYNNHVQYLHLI